MDPKLTNFQLRILYVIGVQTGPKSPQECVYVKGEDPRSDPSGGDEGAKGSERRRRRTGGDTGRGWVRGETVWGLAVARVTAQTKITKQDAREGGRPRP